MVDEIMNASPSKFRFPEAGLRVMVTSHFGPKTRLRMASRLIITEVQLLVDAPTATATFQFSFRLNLGLKYTNVRGDGELFPPPFVDVIIGYSGKVLTVNDN